jgi:hypothetical protein
MILLRIPWARAALDRIATHQAASLHFTDWRSFFDALPQNLRRGVEPASRTVKSYAGPCAGRVMRSMPGRPSSCRQTCTLPCPTGRPGVRDAWPASIREKLRRAYAGERAGDNPRMHQGCAARRDLHLVAGAEAVFGGKTKSGVPAWRFRVDKLSAQNLRIRIPAVQFCSLVDMYAFQVLHAL